MEIYLKVKTLLGKILQIYSDALKITLDLFFYKELILFAMKIDNTWKERSVGVISI